MLTYRQWDPISPTCVIWLQKELGPAVLFHDQWNGTLQLKTVSGERYVPSGWWIIRDEEGNVTISQEEPDG